MWNIYIYIYTCVVSTNGVSKIEGEHNTALHNCGMRTCR